MVIDLDKLTKEQRSANMRAIKSKDTKIEVKLRKALWHQGIRYRKNYKICDCRVDIAITKHKIAVFCDGDFWHGNDKYTVDHNSKFWNLKININKERDLFNTIALRDNGWTVLRFWGSEINASISNCVNIIISEIKK